MRRLVLLLGLLLVPLMWLGAEPAAACSCVVRTVPELVADADAVIAGRLVESRVDGQEASYTFFGTERFKGGDTPGFEVLSSASGASCGLTGLVEGRRYVVFMEERGGSFTANSCGGTRPASSRFVARVEAVTGPGMSFDLPPPGPEDPVPEPLPDAVLALAERLSAAWWR